MGYCKKTVVAGGVTFATKYWRPGIYAKMKGRARGPRQNPTPERVAAINQRNAERHLQYLLLENFRAGDLFILLTYREESRPQGRDEAKEQIQAFLRKAREVYRKAGKEFRYIWVCEYREKPTHFHLVCPRIDPGLLAEIWPHGMVRPEYLYREGHFKQLAEYLIKETSKTFREGGVHGRRWCGSKNLRKYSVKVEETDYKSWRDKPAVPKGYYLVGEVETGIDDFNGTPWQYYCYEPIGRSERRDL